jgi:hypothetical protein
MNTQNLPCYLYRALNRQEIAAENVLIPKARNLYQADRILPEGLPFDLGENPKSARQRHQHPTSYVSTTPHLARAKYYATYSDSSRQIVPIKTVVTIDTATFDALGIVAHHVATEFTPDQISKPEDDEFLLEYRGEHELPKAIIINVETL